jgi:hypothetical protein
LLSLSFYSEFSIRENSQPTIWISIGIFFAVNNGGTTCNQL